MCAVLASLILWSAVSAATPPVMLPTTALVDCTSSCDAATREAISATLYTEIEKSADHRWVEAPPISIDDLALALDCQRFDEACARKALSTLKLGALVWAHVDTGRGRQIVVKLVLVDGGARTEKVPHKSSVDSKALVRACRRLLGPSKPARLVVLSDPPGALVRLDETERGQTPLTLDDVAEGPHRIVVSREGHLTQTMEIALSAGDTSQLRVALPRGNAPVAAAAAPPPTAVPPVSSPPARQQPLRKGRTALGWPPFVVAGVAGVVLAGVPFVAGVTSSLAYWTAYALMYLRAAQVTAGTEGNALTSRINHRGYVLFRTAQYPLLVVSAAATGLGVLAALLLAAAAVAVAAIPLWLRVGGSDD